MTGTRNKKVARSFESLGVEFDPLLPSAAAKGFTSTNAQDAIVEAKTAPASDIWDENDNGAVTAADLHDWATKRFFHVQQRTYPIYDTADLGIGGGSYYQGARWNFHKLTTVVSGASYLPELGSPTYPQLVAGSINGKPPGSNTPTPLVPADAGHYDSGYITLPGPAVWKIKARVGARGNRAQLRIDCGQVSNAIEYKRGCIYSSDPTANAAKIYAFTPSISNLTGLYSSTNGNPGIMNVVLSSPLSSIPVIGQPLLCVSAQSPFDGNDESIVYVTSVTDASTFSVKGKDTSNTNTSGKNITICEIVEHGLTTGQFIESIDKVPTFPTGFTTHTVGGFGKKLSEITADTQWMYSFYMKTSNAGPDWSSAISLPSYPIDGYFRLADSAYIRNLPMQVYFGMSTDPAGSVITISEIECIAELSDPTTNIYLWQYANGNPNNDEDMGVNTPSGAPNIHADLICERIA